MVEIESMRYTMNCSVAMRQGIGTLHTCSGDVVTKANDGGRGSLGHASRASLEDNHLVHTGLSYR